MFPLCARRKAPNSSPRETFLRHIRVISLNELKTRILKGFYEMNQLPVVFRWNKLGIDINICILNAGANY